MTKTFFKMFKTFYCFFMQRDSRGWKFSVRCHQGARPLFTLLVLNTWLPFSRFPLGSRMTARTPVITSIVPVMTFLFQATGRKKERAGSREGHTSILVKLETVVFFSWWQYGHPNSGFC